MYASHKFIQFSFTLDLFGKVSYRWLVLTYKFKLPRLFAVISGQIGDRAHGNETVIGLIMTVNYMSVTSAISPIVRMYSHNTDTGY